MFISTVTSFHSLVGGKIHLVDPFQTASPSPSRRLSWFPSLRCFPFNYCSNNFQYYLVVFYDTNFYRELYILTITITFSPSIHIPYWQRSFYTSLYSSNACKQHSFDVMLQVLNSQKEKFPATVSLSLVKSSSTHASTQIPLNR